MRCTCGCCRQVLVVLFLRSIWTCTRKKGMFVHQSIHRTGTAWFSLFQTQIGIVSTVFGNVLWATCFVLRGKGRHCFWGIRRENFETRLRSTRNEVSNFEKGAMVHTTGFTSIGNGRNHASLKVPGGDCALLFFKALGRSKNNAAIFKI